VRWTAGDLTRSLLKAGGGSFLSGHDPRLVLGLGKESVVSKLEIHWPLPSSKIDVFSRLPVDRYVTIVEGEGIVS
jgi:hypothetical protein